MPPRSEKIRQLGRLFEEKSYSELKKALAAMDDEPLASAWPQLGPLEKLAFFKLMDPPRALAFYGGLSFKEKYFLLCGFPLNSIAPLLEGLEAGQRRLFHQMPRDFYDRMFRQLVSERVEMDIPLRNN